jgi:hypothetical protein
VVTITSILKITQVIRPGMEEWELIELVCEKCPKFLKRVGGSGSKPQVRNILISIGAEHNKGTDVWSIPV